MSNGEADDVRNHYAAWVLSNAIEIGIDQDTEGFTLNTTRCAILQIASIEDI